MSYSLNDAQREILGREMQPSEVEGWANSIWEIAENLSSGTGDSAVEAKISIIQNSKEPHTYDEMRRRQYPDIGDQLDDLYRQGAFSDSMAATLGAVKENNPKG
jgi:hypothetical protein